MPAYNNVYNSWLDRAISKSPLFQLTWTIGKIRRAAFQGFPSAHTLRSTVAARQRQPPVATNHIQYRCTQLKMNKLQILALSSFILVHLLLISQFIVEISNHDDSSFFGFTIWALGIVTAISNIIFADKLVKGWVQIVFSICALLWIFPPLIISYPGMAMAVGFFIIGTFLHIKGIKKRKLIN